MSERWLVCGGSKFDRKDFVNEKLDQFVVERGRPLLVIEGEAPGVDTLARLWAESNGIPVIKVPVKQADKDRYGNYAFAIRNSLMLTHWPHIVIAFPGGNGTADMVAKARRAGVDVLEVAR